MSASGQAHEQVLPGGVNGVELAGLLPPETSAGKFPKMRGMQASTIFRQTEGHRYDASLPAGVTVIEGPFDDGTAEAGTIAMPSPRDTKSKSELNWLVMILWLNTTPRSLAAISSVRRNPETLGIEIMGSSMQIECGSGNTAEDVGNLSGRQSRCNRGFHQVAHTRISFYDTSRSDKLPDIMRDFLIAIVFLVGTVLFLGGELFFGHLFSTPTAATGIGAVLCFLAAVAKDRIDRDMTLF